MSENSTSTKGAPLVSRAIRFGSSDERQAYGARIELRAQPAGKDAVKEARCAWSVASAAGCDAFKISFRCSILYRLLSVKGARFLRSSRCRKATGRSTQLTHRNPSGCPLPSLQNMSGERKSACKCLQSCKASRSTNGGPYKRMRASIPQPLPGGITRVALATCSPRKRTQN
jgi:hypothetical protein